VALLGARQACADPVKTVCSNGEVAWGRTFGWLACVGRWIVWTGWGFAKFFDYGLWNGWERPSLEGSVISAEADTGVVGGRDAFKGFVPAIAWECSDFVGTFDRKRAYAVTGFAFEKCSEDRLDFGRKNQERDCGQQQCVEDEPPDDLGGDGEREESAFSGGRWRGFSGHRDR
jgi:hypothetical protein